MMKMPNGDIVLGMNADGSPDMKMLHLHKERTQQRLTEMTKLEESLTMYLSRLLPKGNEFAHPSNDGICMLLATDIVNILRWPVEHELKRLQAVEESMKSYDPTEGMVDALDKLKTAEAEYRRQLEDCPDLMRPIIQTMVDELIGQIEKMEKAIDKRMQPEG